MREKGRTTRKEYLLAGLVLFALKYGVDLYIALSFDKHWSPLAYVMPRFNPLFEFEKAPGLWIALLIAAVPFAVTGLILTLRRLKDAGAARAWALIFFAPFVNLILFAVLAALPTRERPELETVPTFRDHDASGDPPPPPVPLLMRLLPSGLLGRWFVAVLVTGALTVGYGLLIRYGRKGIYGALVFTLMPALNGAIAEWLFCYGTVLRRGRHLGALLGACAVWFALLWVTGIEGLSCLILVWPITIPFTLIGAMIGRAAATDHYKRSLAALTAAALLTLPLLWLPVPWTPQTVHTEITIAASPQQIWPHIIAFPPIEQQPSQPFFALGYGAPVQATLARPGVGAARACVFTQGRFVERVDLWQPPHRFGFTVDPGSTLLPKWLRAERARFMLRDNGDGTTTLLGASHIRTRVQPQLYWQPIVRWAIRSIHLRVFRHIKRLAERDARRQQRKLVRATIKTE